MKVIVTRAWANYQVGQILEPLGRAFTNELIAQGKVRPADEASKLPAPLASVRKKTRVRTQQPKGT